MTLILLAQILWKTVENRNRQIKTNGKRRAPYLPTNSSASFSDFVFLRYYTVVFHRCCTCEYCMQASEAFSIPSQFHVRFHQASIIRKSTWTCWCYWCQPCQHVGFSRQKTTTFVSIEVNAPSLSEMLSWNEMTTTTTKDSLDFSKTQDTTKTTTTDQLPVCSLVSVSPSTTFLEQGRASDRLHVWKGKHLAP